MSVLLQVAAVLSEAEMLRKKAWEVYDCEAWEDCRVNPASSGPTTPRIFSANLPGYKQKLFRLEVRSYFCIDHLTN